MDRESINIQTLLEQSDDIVISGIGGRFPESDSVDEFAHNLYNNVDMITDDDRRWPRELYDMNPRMGKINSIEKFDGAFFGIMSMLADSIDPQSRILLETTFEAITDSGINPQTIRGTKTGVYVGNSTIGMPDSMPQELQEDSRTSLTEGMMWTMGTAKSMYSNRISFIFDFRGPSLTIDTACSSSMAAFDVAVTDLRLGKCEQAIVAGSNINLQPYTNHIYQSDHFNPSDGICKVWDEDADGFVRGEAVVAIFLQKKSNAKRIYATVIHSRTNIDGYKKTGVFFPSSECQKDLMVETYKEAGIDPLDVNYFEAHGTGTKAGDTQEAKAIYNAYCVDRKNSLPVGLLKSNIGHGEGASGLSSIVKLILSYENSCIAANLNLTKLKPEIAELCPPLLPVNKNLPYIPGIAGINSFGIGGVNGHALLKPNDKLLSDESLRISDKIPRLINLCARSEQSLNDLFDFIENNQNKITRDFLALINDTAKVKPQLNTAGFPYRGSMIIKNDNNSDGTTFKYNYKRESSLALGTTQKPIWFLFTGLGSQWTAMAKALMPIDIFSSKIKECADILRDFGIDLNYLLLSKDENSMNDMTSKFVATTAIQISMYEIFKKLDIIPDGIIGHSFGEIACAYADECLTTEQALLASYWRGKVTENNREIPKGMMAAVGLSWNEVALMCPKSVLPVCHNSAESTTISGLYDDSKQLLDAFISKNIFVRQLDSCGIPYHTPFLEPVAKQLTEKLSKFIPLPKLRSNKWISTSVAECYWDTDMAKYASAEYFVNNFISPVLFYESIQKLPDNAIIIEIAPHSLFEKIINRNQDSMVYIGLMKRNQSETNLEYFLTSIGKLYQLGVNPLIENLYPKVEWPVVRGTQSLSSLMKWDHSDSYLVKKYPNYHFPSTASDMRLKFSLSNPDYKFLADHCIDGRKLMPATGYLMLAWRRLAASLGKQWNKFAVIFENIHFRRPIFLSDKEDVELTVKYFAPTGDFAILEGLNISCYGNIFASDDNPLQLQHHLTNKYNESDINNNENKALQSNTYTASDVYKELRVRGYDYGPKFQCIEEVTNDGNMFIANGKIKWLGNWESFADSMLQISATALPIRNLIIPVMLQSLRCDPKIFFDAIEEAKEVLYDEKFVDLDESAKELTSIDKSPNSNINISFGDDNDITEEEFRGHVRSEMQHFQHLSPDYHEKYRSVLPVYANFDLKCFVAKGIEIKGLIGAPIPRKFAVQGLNLESYEFIANNEHNAIHESLKNQLTSYLNVCVSLASKLLKYCGLDEHCLLNGYTKISDNEIKLFLQISKEEHVIFRYLNKVVNSIENRITEEMKPGHIYELLTESIIDIDINEDLIYQVWRNDRLIRPVIDLIFDNYASKREIKVVEISGCNNFIALQVEDYLTKSCIIPVKIDYTVVYKTIDSSMQDEFTQKGFQMSSLDPSSNVLIPTSVILNAELLIHLDSEQLWDIDLSAYLLHIHSNLANNGFFLAILRTKLTSPELALNHILGKTNLNDCMLSRRIENFESIATKLGLKLISRKYDSLFTLALLFRKVNYEPQPNEQTVVEILTENYDKWVEVLKEKINYVKENANDGKNIWLIANDSQLNGILGLTNCLRQESCGHRIRCIFDFDGVLSFPPDFSKQPFSDILANDLIVNVYRDQNWGTFRHLNLVKQCDQIETSNFHLNVDQIGDLSSLQWYDSSRLKQSDVLINFENEEIERVKCEIYYSGINFRDVMLASGRIFSTTNPIATESMIGTEFVGRRCDTGERVFGNEMGAFSSSQFCRKDLISKIPDQWSMEEAATIISAYFTVWYGLIDRAQLRKGESILIHSGCGGVGQAAINVCQYYQCTIFTTVGNEEKKQYLIKTYNFPEQRIFSSRDVAFEEKIMLATKGRGVNVVLNSLIDEKMQSGFRCLANDGRFIEIGKYDLQMDKKLGMFPFLRNISFLGISIDNPLYNGGEKIQQYFKWIELGAIKGYVKPINSTVYRLNEVEKAFRFMLTGKHIGKLLIKVRDEENERICFGVKPVKIIATLKTFFDPNKVYLIIGGLGGVGLELLLWMTYKGARNIVVTSRTGIKNNYQKVLLQSLKNIGEQFKAVNVNVSISTHNANDYSEAKRLLDHCNQFGPIGGVFHLALVLSDGLIENQTVDKFDQTCGSKIKPCINMDKLTREFYPDIDYFVMFSSLSCGRGFVGQTNYGYANSVMERVCEMRRKDGLHGIAIQYGPIRDVGVLENTEISSMASFLSQRVSSCLDVLDKFLQYNFAIVSSTVKANRISQSGLLEENMINQLWSALGVDPKTLPNNVTLGELGMDSMVAVEFQQSLEREYDIKLSLNDVKRITVKEVKEFQSGDKERLKRISLDIKKARANLIKIRFIIPSESYTRLNDVCDGKPIYILPPIEGIYDSIKDVVKDIRRPVIGLNMTELTSNFKTFKEYYNYYVKMLKNLSPNGNFDVISYSFGAMIAAKMLRKKLPINKLVIVDVFSRKELSEKIQDDDYLEPIKIFVSQVLPEIFHERVLREIDSIRNNEENIKNLAKELKEFGGKGLVDNDLDEILRQIVERSKILHVYLQKCIKKMKKLKSETVKKELLKTKTQFLYITTNDVNDALHEIHNTYGIDPQIIEDKVDINTIPVKPEEIFSKDVDHVVNIINDFLL